MVMVPSKHRPNHPHVSVLRNRLNISHSQIKNMKDAFYALT